MKRLFITLIYLLASTNGMAGGKSDDPLLTTVMINELEVRSADGPASLALDAEAWIGYDLNKLWFKTEADAVEGETDEAEVQLLYSRAIARYWDFQAGWRRDIGSKQPDRDWLSLGFKGLAPYFFEVDAELFFGESGRVNARLNAEYEVLFTQRLILTPEVQINLFSKDDAAVGIGSGLSDLELSLRLRYEIRREFAPYIGVNWTTRYGQTAGFSRDEGGDSSDVQVVVGVRVWF